MAHPAFERHLDHCNNTTLPGDRALLFLGPHPIGYVAHPLMADPLLTGLLHAQPDGTALIRSQADLHDAARRLADAGHIVFRDEPFDVRSDRTGEPVATLDRGALPDFGIAATGVHLNGLVERDGATFLWVARRARHKLLDPGKLDHLAAGGVPAGLTTLETLAKEAAEECGLRQAAIAAAEPVAIIRYAMQRPEGLRRDALHCFDITLPPDWRPVAHDGEVETFELWPLERALQTVRDTDDFKFNVNLVLIDLFIRRGLLSDAGGVIRGRLLGESKNGALPRAPLGTSAPRPA